MSNNNNTPTEEEVLTSRGFNSNVITLRGFTSYGYRDRSRDVLSAVDVWDLQLRILVKNKAWRNHILFDYKDSRVPVLGSNGQSMLVNKDTHHYYDNELLYLPLRLTGKRYHHIPESELSIFEQESKDEGVYWVEAIAGETPTSELLRGVSPLMEQATHIFQEDHALNETSEINNSPHNLENVEIFYKAVPQCNKWDCPLCLQLPKFLEAHAQARKKARDWFLVGLRFDHPEAIRYDNLKALQELTKLASTAFNVFNVNASIWDSWSRLDELDN